MAEPRILVLDIETLPTLAWVWGLWKQDVYIDRIVIPTRMTCFAASWLDDRRMQFFAEFDPDNPRSMFEIGESGMPQEASWVAKPHREMVLAAAELLDEADAVVHYNGKSFDVPHLFREFQTLDVDLPSPFKQIDLMKGAKEARYLSNKLEYVSRQIGLGGKASDGGFQTWLSVMAGDPKAMRRFARYNRRDVGLSKEVFYDLRPYLKGIPNYNLFLEEGEDDGCPKCGSKDIQKRGRAITDVSVFQQIWCKDCKGWSRVARRESGADVRGMAAS